MLFETKWSTVMLTSALGLTPLPCPRNKNQVSHLLLGEHGAEDSSEAVLAQYDLLSHPLLSYMVSRQGFLPGSKGKPAVYLLFFSLLC